MKNFKKVLALVLVVAMMMSFVVVASAKTYTDEKAINNKEAVDVLSYIGVLGGYPAGDFKPTNAITRAEAAKIIAIFKNGDTNISDLYKTANTFADVKGNWAESYVAYCAKAGIVSGRNENTFDPQANVTGVEFLKMALVVLGLDADAEGYKGAAWQVNILQDAKQIGLLAGLGKNWEPAKAITREEAAQVMLNALQSYKYEYGIAPKLGIDAAKVVEALKLYGMSEYEKAVQAIIDSLGIWVTKAGAIATKTLLMSDWNLAVDFDQDDFGRPVKSWSDTKGTIIPTDDEKLFTTAIAPAAEYTTAVKKCDALVAAGIKKSNTTDYAEHYIDGYYDCDLYHNTNCTDEMVGGQGVLTQVFNVNGVYYVTEIHTYLAEVTAVNKYKATIHTDAYTEAELLVHAWSWSGDFNATYKTDALAKGDYVLVTWSQSEGKIESCVKTAPVATAAQTAFNYAKETSTIGGKTYAWAYEYELGYVGDNGKTYDVFVDQYGNLIGLVEPAAKYNFGVIDAMAWTNSYKPLDPAVALANLTMMDAAAKTGVVVKALGTDELVVDDTPTNDANPAKFEVNENVAKNAAYYKTLYKFSVDAKGKYTIELTAHNVANVDIVKAVPTMIDGYSTNDATVYLVKTAEGYTSYTGYKTVPTMGGVNVSYFMDNEDDPAKAHYITYMYVDATKAIYEGASFTAAILTGYEVGMNGKNYTYDLFVGTEAKSYDVAGGKDLAAVGFTGADAYKVTLNAAGEIMSVKVLVAGTDYKTMTAITANNGTAMTDGTDSYNVTNAKYYAVTAYGVEELAFTEVVGLTPYAVFVDKLGAATEVWFA